MSDIEDEYDNESNEFEFEQTNEDDRLWEMYNELKNYANDAAIPLLDNMNLETLSQFVLTLTKYE